MMRSANDTQQAARPLLLLMSLFTLIVGLAATAAPAQAARLTCNGKPATITTNDDGDPVGPGKDEISGTRGRDVIVTLGGRDTVFGNGGADLICLGGGNDYSWGDAGDDRIWGGGGIDYMVGSTGDDRIWGGGGDDYSPGIQNKKPGKNGRLVGGPGDDRLFGGRGADLLRGNEGKDRMLGEQGDDDLDGGAHNDRCAGGSGFDRGSECEQMSGINDTSWFPVGRVLPPSGS